MRISALFDNSGRHARRMLAATLAVLAAQITAAEANTRACRQIEAQLAALPSGGNASTARTQRHDAAIARQQDQMRKAREQARQAGCGSAMSGRAVSFCASITGTMERMERNLVDLQRQRAQMGRADNRRERARLQAALDRNNCREPARRAPEAAAPATRGQHSVNEARAGSPARTLRGNFRTMCVRTCDGYYFPVSNSVPQSAFERDQRACQAMCPGTAVELHHHRMPGEESEDMVSAVTGLPYRQMSSAFLYRQKNASIPAGCGCNAAATGTMASSRGFEVIGGDYRSGIVEDNTSAETTAAIPSPSARPDPAEDPETLASRDGGLDADTLKRLTLPTRPTPPTAGADTGERPVRVVGPQFLPDPEEAIDLRVQVPAPGP